MTFNAPIHCILAFAVLNIGGPRIIRSVVILITDNLLFGHILFLALDYLWYMHPPFKDIKDDKILASSVGQRYERRGAYVS